MNTTVPGGSVRWQEHAGKHVKLRAPQGSIADQAAARHLRSVDAIVEQLVKLLDPPADKAREVVDVYLPLDAALFDELRAAIEAAVPGSAE